MNLPTDRAMKSFTVYDGAFADRLEECANNVEKNLGDSHYVELKPGDYTEISPEQTVAFVAFCREMAARIRGERLDL